MKRFVLLIIVNAVLLNFCFTQTSVWQVKGKGSTMYIGGTFHLLRSTDYPLPAEFDTAFAKSEILIFEANLEKLEDPEVAQKMMTKSMYTNGKTLKESLSKEVYAALKEEGLKLVMPIENLSLFKPSMVILTFTMMRLKKLNLSATGVDKYYYTKGEESDKSFDFLETVDEQIDLITTMGDGNEDEYVLSSLEDFDKMEDHLNDLLADWKNGTDEFMLSMITDMKKDYPKIYEAMLPKRNNNWMPKIESFLAGKKTAFVMVGAMHLHGDDGLIKLLTDKGYSVEQLKID